RVDLSQSEALCEISDWIFEVSIDRRLYFVLNSEPSVKPAAPPGRKFHPAVHSRYAWVGDRPQVCALCGFTPVTIVRLAMLRTRELADPMAGTWARCLCR